MEQKESLGQVKASCQRLYASHAKKNTTRLSKDKQYKKQNRIDRIDYVSRMVRINILLLGLKFK